ncbi:hypothetical protein Pmani_031587 [Petrolisthes manimaculis]|uniref:Uncharacterized protein n=1 Tax=Petrolisthes manimaculis TaxID=1843537 RepID=A0AAE1NTC5_9EUCA|nr:hypothetical protein Pmani_031587 [Petrolisthes manimaculis]
MVEVEVEGWYVVVEVVGWYVEVEVKVEVVVGWYVTGLGTWRRRYVVVFGRGKELKAKESIHLVGRDMVVGGIRRKIDRQEEAGTRYKNSETTGTDHKPGNWLRGSKSKASSVYQVTEVRVMVLVTKDGGNKTEECQGVDVEVVEEEVVVEVVVREQWQEAGIDRAIS